MADRRTLVARVAGRAFFHGVLGSVGLFQVHSVFDRVVNLTRPRPGAREAWQASPREFFSLAATGVGFAPYFLTVETADSLRSLPVRPGDRVVVEAGRLLIGRGVEVDCSHLAVRDLPPPAAPAGPLGARAWLVDHLERLVREEAGRARSGGEPWPERVRAALEAVRRGLLGGEAGEVGRGVAGLVGYGPGLTPAGDDLLLGLSYVWLAGHGREGTGGASLVRAVLRCLDRTSEMSAFFLREALKLQVHEWVRDVFCAVTEGNLADVEATGRRLLRLGATSGADIAEGMCLGFRWMGEIAWQKR